MENNRLLISDHDTLTTNRGDMYELIGKGTDEISKVIGLLKVRRVFVNYKGDVYKRGLQIGMVESHVVRPVVKKDYLKPIIRTM